MIASGIFLAFIVLLSGGAWLLGQMRGRALMRPRTDEERVEALRFVQMMRDMQTVALRLTPAQTPGFSKLGGEPELPTGAGWPMGPEGPLGFLVQLDLAEVRAQGGPEWLPATGGLYAFHDDRFGLRDQVRIIHSADAPRARLSPPAQLKWRYPERLVAFVGQTSIPSLDWLGGDIRKVRIEDADLAHLAEVSAQENTQHRIGGYPDEIQEDQMPLSCEYESRGLEWKHGDPVPASIEAAKRDWRLLLQIDSDTELKMNWGDTGMLYVFIREQDARAGDFSQTVTLSQTY